MNDDLMRRFNNFSSKVYLTFGAQLFLTFAIVLNNHYKRVIFSDEMISLGFLGILSCYYLLTASTYTNQNAFIKIFLVGIFSFCKSIVINNFLMNYSLETIFNILISTATIFTTLTLVASQQRSNYNIYKGIKYSLIQGIIIIGLFGIIFRTNILDILYAILLVVLFSIYVIIDTQYVLLTDSYYFANNAYSLLSVKLYVDFVILFIRLFKLVLNIK
jgi:FtsH-binding integral membrane protein